MSSTSTPVQYYKCLYSSELAVVVLLVLVRAGMASRLPNNSNGTKEQGDITIPLTQEDMALIKVNTCTCYNIYFNKLT